jgi:hypothetical protein
VPRRNQKGNSSDLHRSRVGSGRCRGTVRFERHCGVMGDPSSHVCARSGRTARAYCICNRLLWIDQVCDWLDGARKFLLSGILGVRGGGPAAGRR